MIQPPASPIGGGTRPGHGADQSEIDAYVRELSTHSLDRLQKVTVVCHRDYHTSTNQSVKFR